jgi:hypothetical protein
MHCEIVWFTLYDVGRSINLAEVKKVLPASLDIRIVKSKDTPEAIALPQPLQLEIENLTLKSPGSIDQIRLQAKIYEDGVISFITRANIPNIELTRLHTIKSRAKTSFSENDAPITISDWVEKHFMEIYQRIANFIDPGFYKSEKFTKETYTAYCIMDSHVNAAELVQNNRAYLAALLSDENPDYELHESRIQNTLDHPFSFLKNDLVILDIDRCLIIDPARDYEDILLMCELANYELLEVRVLDEILNRYLDKTEDYFKTDKTRKTKHPRNMWKELQSFRIDALFVLENLENFTKIIGDYFLGQVYSHLLELFNTNGWIKSVQSHLELLEDLFENFKQDRANRTVIIIEWLATIFFLVEIIYSTIDFFHLS